jgi:aminoglycoside phosphotransferase (APT) family kinase protein
MAWVEQVTGGRLTGWRPITGGNRCRSWAVDVVAPGPCPAALYLRYQPPRPPSVEPYTVWREARVYQALRERGVTMPELIAIHPEVQAILTERAPGRADFRRAPASDQASIALDFIHALAALHRTRADPRLTAQLTQGRTIGDCVREELSVWRAMYEETGESDILIDFALDWLEQSTPEPEGLPVLVHGDAGPGNFLFANGHMTALLDWELAHMGDPMEDLAWFSMRSVMEPVPNFAACLAAYARETGAPIDLARVRYHRVFVCARVVIIRHRNVTGRPGASIISRALNRRLLITALAEANGVALRAAPALASPPTARTRLYDGVIDDMRVAVAAATRDLGIAEAAKNAARVLKYLRDVDRFGGDANAADLDAVETLLGVRPPSLASGLTSALAALRNGALGLGDLIAFFAGQTSRDAQLAASASGGLAERTFPPLTLETEPHA